MIVIELQLFMLREVCETVAVWVCGCTFGGVYVPCIYLHARWSYLRQLRYVVASLICGALLTLFVYFAFICDRESLKMNCVKYFAWSGCNLSVWGSS